MTNNTEDPHLSELVRGAALALANAEDLFCEGTALLTCRAFSRALFLYQISLEEYGKAEVLGWWATGHLMGVSVDLSNIRRRLASHKAKNFANAYMLPFGEAEQKARDQCDWRAENVAFKEEQAAFHQQSNDRKNASLYVDLIDGTFVTPRDRITDQMVREIAATNHGFIELMRPKVEMLTLWAQEPDGARESIKSFRDRIEKLREEYPDEPYKGFDVLLDEILTQAREAQQYLGQTPPEAAPSATPDEPSR